MFPSKAQKLAPVTIFEDVMEDEELVLNRGQPRGKTLLGKPAKKAGTAMAGSVGPTVASAEAGGLREARQPRSRPSICRPDIPVSTLEKQGVIADGVMSRRQSILSGQIKKEPRRRTIFMPEDTTIMTIHPGARTTNQLDDTFQLPGLAVQPPSDYQYEQDENNAARPKAMRRPRRSLAAAPKRMPFAPLQAENNLEGMDVCGANTGKENLPPGHEKVLKGHVVYGGKVEAPAPSIIRSRLTQPTAASQSRQSVPARNAVPLVRRSTATNSPHGAVQTLRLLPSGVKQGLRSNNTTTSKPVAEATSRGGVERSSLKSMEAEEKRKLRETIANKRREMQTSKLKNYPVLAEDLAQPELYEDGWLRDQEVSLTEILNEILTASKVKESARPASLRQSMVDLYHQPNVSTLHRRLQASLIYGALCKPKTLTEALDPMHDIGLRKRYLSLWLESYDEDTLRTAAEVIVGRQVPRQSAGSSDVIKNSEEILDPRASRRSLTGFLETFFVSVGDLDNHVGGGLSPDTLRWRKTMLRSIMLVWLLDQTKATGLLQGCLFQPKSKHKSSVSVLHELSGMLMPSIGDIVRVLKQMDYEVDHTQDPLDEVDYCVNSIAVDLRDGILLTHLVETLIYNRQVLDELQCEEDATITVNLPDATVLFSTIPSDAMQKPPRLLSQHLKMPALAHAQKAFNVQIALSALEETGIAGANVVGDITAEDIVHGHREKTLSFLWSLVSAYGLNHLVDWKMLAADIQHRINDVPELVTSTAAAGTITTADQDEILRLWAAAYAGMEKARNLTTAFADGRIYAAILSGFAPYYNTAITSSRSDTLRDRLRSLGCSNAFIKHLTSTLGVIPSRETTLSNLAFLASRLLPLARRHRAAAAIQRAYRTRLASRRVSQRVKLMRLARDCAVVVRTGARMAAAATVLQRAWRGVLAERVGRLERDVLAFQRVARGWQVRRLQGRRRDGVGYTSRTMVGW